MMCARNTGCYHEGSCPDQAGLPLRWVLTDIPSQLLQAGGDYQGYVLRACRPGSGELVATIRLGAQHLSWAGIGMDYADATRNDREDALVGAFVGACEQALFMGWVNGDVDVRLSDTRDNPIKFYYRPGPTFRSEVPPTFHFEKDGEYELKLADTVRRRVLTTLKPHYSTGMLVSDLLRAVGLDKNLVSSNVEWLRKNGHVRVESGDAGAESNRLWITDEGVAALAGTAVQTPAAAGNVLVVNQMQNSVVQQAGAGSTQTVAFDMRKRPELESALEELRGQLAAIELPADARQELEAKVQTLQAQLASPRPKPCVVAEAVRVIREVLTAAAGGVAATLLSKWMGL